MLPEPWVPEGDVERSRELQAQTQVPWIKYSGVLIPMPYGVAAEEGLDDSPDEVFPDGSLDEAFESVPDEALEDEFAGL